MKSLLEKAILAENFAQVEKLLLENPPIIDEISREGLPQSFLAAKTGNLQVVKYIVEYSRANMNERDGWHRNILHYATLSGNLELVKYLVERVGMSPIDGDCDLTTPYDLAHWAAEGTLTKQKLTATVNNCEGSREQMNCIEKYFADVTGFAYEEAYKNPVRTGFYPDPSIIRVGEDYYMVNSSFIFFPCIPVSHSKDLIHWKIIGYAITNPEWAYLDELEGGRGYWAPDISYYKGRFYICATYRLNDTGTVYRKQMVVSSDKPEGPYSEPVFLDEDGIDPSIFTDDDGRRYMLLNRGARIFEISEDATRQMSPATLLFYGDQKRAPEGPHLLKKDGYYYLFEAEGGTGAGHRITVSRSKELFGVYEPCPYNPIMRQNDEKAPIQRCGHGKPVQTAEGNWYMVYLCGRMIDGRYSMLGRETAIDPITWTADGWPIVNSLKGPSVLQKRPLPFWNSQSIVAEDQNLFGAGDSLPLEWMTPRTPVPGAIRVQKGVLYLDGSPLPLSDVGARNILVRRQENFNFAAETVMKVIPMKNGQQAGLVCYYDENTWVSCAVVKEAEGLFVQVQEHIDAEDRFHGKRKIADDIRTISFEVETRGLERKFLYSLDGEEKKEAANLPDVYYICDEGLKKGKRFTGAMIGVFAYAGTEKWTATFTNFSYRTNI